MDELRIAPPGMVELTGVDKNTVRDFLAGKRRLQAATQLRFDDALRWEPGSLRRMYSGGTPVPVEEPAPHVDPLEVVSDDELVAEILRRMKGARRGVEGEEESPAPSQGGEGQKTDLPDEAEERTSLRRIEGRLSPKGIGVQNPDDAVDERGGPSARGV